MSESTVNEGITEYITQGELDQLLNSAEEGDQSEEPDSKKSPVSQDDIDQLLSSAVEGDQSEEPDSKKSPVSQDDIDQLLNSAVEGDEASAADNLAADTSSGDIQTDSDDSLVSQDDIDQLLGSAVEGDEAPAADNLAADTSSGDIQTDSDDSLVSQDDIDQMIHTSEGSEQTQTDDTIVQQNEAIAEPDESLQQQETISVSENSDIKEKNKKVWYTSKLIWICASVALFAAFGVYFFSPQSTIKILDKTIQKDISKSNIEQNKHKNNKPEITSEPLVMTFKEFIVPAPFDREDITYITTVISIEIESADALKEMKKHTPYFRDIIYKILLKALIPKKKLNIKQENIKDMILKSLNSALYEQAIKSIKFTSFEII